MFCVSRECSLFAASELSSTWAELTIRVSQDNSWTNPFGGLFLWESRCNCHMLMFWCWVAPKQAVHTAWPKVCGCLSVAAACDCRSSHSKSTGHLFSVVKSASLLGRLWHLAAGAPQGLTRHFTATPKCLLAFGSVQPKQRFPHQTGRAICEWTWLGALGCCHVRKR